MKLFFGFAIVLTLAYVSGKPLSKQYNSLVEDVQEPSKSKGSNNYEDIRAKSQKRIEAIDSTLIRTGLLKYLSIPEKKRHETIMLTGTPEEVQQFEDSKLIVQLIMASDPEANETLEKLLLLFEARGNGEGTEEQKAEIIKLIRKLDAKFEDVPAWGRYWIYINDKYDTFLETYG